MNEFGSELKNFERAMAEAEKQAETASSKYAQYAAIDPSKIPSKMPENPRKPLCVAMKEVEKATFEAAKLSDKVIRTMQDLPNFEPPLVGSNNMRECIEAMNHNITIVLNVLNSLLCTFGETYG